MTRRRTLACAIAVLACAAAAPSATAATITVDTTDDAIAADGHCSLREAAQAVGDGTRHDTCPAGEGADTIVLPAGTIRFAIPGRNEDNSATGDLDFKTGNGSITLRGQGMNATTIDAAGLDRAIETSGPVLKLQDLTITGGDGSDRGGGASASVGGVDLARVAIVGNRTADGADDSGGGAVAGGDGGGLYSLSGPVTIADSVIADNRTGGGGDGRDVTGGIAAAGSPGGTGVGTPGAKGGSGGGLVAIGTAVNIVNTRITGNRTGNGGNAGAGVGGPGSVAFGGTASNGGAGVGGIAGASGSAGGILVNPANSGNVSITHSVISGNVTGDAGTGGAGTGGTGGSGSPQGAGGLGQGGEGGRGGGGGAIYNVISLSLTDSTIAGNRTGSGGAGGSATGGDAGPGGNPNGGQAVGGAGGHSGNGAGVLQAYYSSVAGSTIDGNRSGAGGKGGSATGGLIVTGGPRVLAGVVGGTGGAGSIGGGFYAIPDNYNAVITANFDFTDVTDNFIDAAGQGGSVPVGASAGAAGATGYGGAIGSVKMDVNLKRSIIRGNTATECKTDGSAAFHASDPLAALGIGPADGSCPGLNADPLLGPLQDNGGPVPSRAPSPLGPVAGRAGDCGTGQEDTRGAVRSNPCEPGSYELDPPAATTGDADAARASVTGTVNTNGPAGVVHFDFGTTDRYGSSTAEQQVGTGFADRAVSGTTSAFPVGTTVHYRVVTVTSDGTAAGADRTFVVPAVQQTPPGGNPPAADKVAPVLKSLKLSLKKFKVGKKVTISFTASEAGKYKLAFDQVLAGKKVRKKGKTTCVKAHGKVAKKSRCSYYKGFGALAGAVKTGSNKVTFAGKVGKKKLARGSYRVTLSATDAAGNKSKSTTTTFKIT